MYSLPYTIAVIAKQTSPRSLPCQQAPVVATISVTNVLKLLMIIGNINKVNVVGRPSL